MKTLIVTGGIATGKSTAIRLLMEKGGPRLRLFDCDAEAGRLLDGGRLKDFLLHKPEAVEVVCTGRDAPAFLTDAADYITEMRCVRHPYQKGITARKGIEF